MKTTILIYFMLQVNRLMMAFDPLQAQILLAHIDDDDGNSPSEVAETATNNGINVQRVLSEEVVGNP